MSLPYIEMRCDLHDDERVQSAASETGVHIDWVCGALRRFWSRAYMAGKASGKHIVVAGWTPAAFEAACGIKGLADALRKVGWVSVTAQGWIVMPNGRSRFVETAKDRQREYENARKSAYREKIRRIRTGGKNVPDNVPDNVPKSPGQCPEMSGTVPGLAKQSASKQNAAQNSAAKQSETGDAVAPIASADFSVGASAAAPALPAPLGNGHSPAMQVRHELIRIGFREPKLSELAAAPGIRPAFLRDLHGRMTAGNHKTGWALRAIESEYKIVARR